MIFFEADLNGVSDTFVLDTGSPGLLLNEVVEKTDSCALQAVGVGGGITFHKQKGQLFQMGNFHKRNLESLSVDLTHLEKVKKQKFRGMVGQSVLQFLEIVLDYEAETMQLLKGGEEEEVAGFCRTKQIPFTFQQHFAVVEVKIGNRNYHFGIDTGAEVNILDTKIAKRLSSRLFTETNSIKIRGVNKKGVSAKVGNISKMNIKGNKIEDMQFVLMDMKNLNSGKGIDLDGLLGYPFLSSGIFSIDYVDQVIHVWGVEQEEIIVRKQ